MVAFFLARCFVLERERERDEHTGVAVVAVGNKKYKNKTREGRPFSLIPYCCTLRGAATAVYIAI